MKKKGQVTLFVILAIFIVFAVGGYFLIKPKTQKAPAVDTSPISSSVSGYISSCLVKVTENGVYYLSFIGGNYVENWTSFNVSGVQVPIYLNGKIKTVPSIKKMQSELNQYMDDNFNSCIEKFNQTNSAYSVHFGTPFFNSTIQDWVNLNLYDSVSIKWGNQTALLHTFNYKYKFDLLSKYLLVNDFINHQANSTYGLSVGYLNSLAEKNNFTYQIMSLNNESYVISLIFNETSQKGLPYIYSFGVNLGGNK